MANSTHQPPGLAYRTAGWAAACLVLLVHLVVAPALPGCHCRHRADTLCPHEDSAPQPAPPPSAVEGAHCHVVPAAATQTAERDGADEAVRLKAAAGSHHGAGAIVGHCDDGQKSPRNYRVGEPYWPVAELVDAPRLGVSPAGFPAPTIGGESHRLLDPPLAPPPRLLTLA